MDFQTLWRGERHEKGTLIPCHQDAETKENLGWDDLTLTFTPTCLQSYIIPLKRSENAESLPADWEMFRSLADLSCTPTKNTDRAFEGIGAAAGWKAENMTTKLLRFTGAKLTAKTLNLKHKSCERRSVSSTWTLPGRAFNYFTLHFWFLWGSSSKAPFIFAFLNWT